MLLVAATLAACSSGHGGDNGHPPTGPVQGLTFSYPYNGQQDVVLDTQLVVDFPGAVASDLSHALSLRAGTGDHAQTTPLNVTQDNNQPGILRLATQSELQPDTTYYVIANRAIAGGNTRYNKGARLFRFTTRPIAGHPADDDFSVLETTPGNTNPATGHKTPFTQFNAVHVIFSQPVDPATVDAGSSFKFTDADGDEVPGRLTVSGHHLTFDPIDDLDPGSYKLALSDGIRSRFGQSLAAYSQSKTVLSDGQTATENLRIEPSSDNVSDLPDNRLNGGPVNLVNISNQLIGSNDLPASNSSARDGLKTTLTEPGRPGFGKVFPAVIRAGQQFQLTPLDLRLNGALPTPVQSGPIQVNFADDADVYLMANDYRNIASPTAVRLRFDMGIGTLITAAAGTQDNIIQSLANGVFNQSALNIQAAGEAIPQDNGDLEISAVGSFSILVNRTDHATVDFALKLTLPGGDQTPVQANVTAPYITAQSPSACLYTFGSPAYGASYAANSAPPTVLPEQLCLQTLSQNNTPDTPSGIDSFPVEASPAITFSKPIDPASVSSDSIALMSASGTPVAATYQTDGTTVVINPDSALSADTAYTIMLNSSASLADLAGNAVTFDNSIGPGQSIAFTTEPRADSRAVPPLLGTLTPGVPCALTGGDFASGGDNAGHCAGDTPSNNNSGTTNPVSFPVFDNPANVAPEAYFSKFVATDSIVLADGCLTSGSGEMNSVADATVAVQRMDGAGQCTGAVTGKLAFANTGDAMTRAFTFRPTENFIPGTRYWIVICGSEGSNCSNSIVDADGTPLNTDPLSGTGSTAMPANGNTSPAGGPDIVMPFDTIAPTTDYYAALATLPETDTNGNGQFDDANGDGQYQAGDERPEPGNRALVHLSSAGTAIPNPNRSSDGAYPSYLSLTRPIAIGKTLQDCSAAATNPGVGTKPDQCIQVALLPGGQTALTSINISAAALSAALGQQLNALATPLTSALTQAAGQLPAGDNTPLGQVPGIGDILSGLSSAPQIPGLSDTLSNLLDPSNPNNTIGTALAGLGQLPSPATVVNNLLASAGLNGVPNPLQTGRIVLRFPDESGDNVPAGTVQSGYIVTRCQGSLNGQAYDYEPCFAASLHLVAQAPDGQGVTFNPQPLTADVVGPVTFEQNGRLVISSVNVNTLTLTATALNSLTTTATINPGGMNFQLAGNATHGGRAFPER